MALKFKKKKEYIYIYKKMITILLQQTDNEFKNGLMPKKEEYLNFIELKK